MAVRIKCKFCWRAFDPARHVPVGSISELSGRGRGGLSIADPERYCDFACGHTGVVAAAYPGGPEYWSCCGGQPGQSWGCRCVVVPHSVDDSPAAVAARSALLDIPLGVPYPIAPAPHVAVMETCCYCDIRFDNALGVPLGGIEDLTGRGRDGKLAIKDETRYCDFMCEHPGDIAETYVAARKTYRYNTCCRAEAGTTWGCRCVVVPHDVGRNPRRERLLMRRNGAKRAPRTSTDLVVLELEPNSIKAPELGPDPLPPPSPPPPPPPPKTPPPKAPPKKDNKFTRIRFYPGDLGFGYDPVKGRSFRNTRDRLQERSNEFGFLIKTMPGDGACQFHAMADQLQSIEDEAITSSKMTKREYTAVKLRANVCNFIDTRDDFGNFIAADKGAYLNAMRDPRAWGDNLTLVACATIHQCNIFLLMSAANITWTQIKPFGISEEEQERVDDRPAIWLAFEQEHHYDSLYTQPRSW